MTKYDLTPALDSKFDKLQKEKIKNEEENEKVKDKTTWDSMSTKEQVDALRQLVLNLKGELA